MHIMGRYNIYSNLGSENAGYKIPIKNIMS